MKLWLAECQAEGWTQTSSAVLHADVLHDALCPSFGEIAPAVGKEEFASPYPEPLACPAEGTPSKPVCYAETAGDWLQVGPHCDTLPWGWHSLLQNPQPLQDPQPGKRIYPIFLLSSVCFKPGLFSHGLSRDFH